MAAVEETHWWYRCLHALVLDQLERFDLEPDSRIVDAGCGTGGLLLRLRASGYCASGFDISPHAITYSRSRDLHVGMAPIIGLSDHIPPHSVAVIICNDVLCYLSHAERMEVLKSWGHLLTDPGRLILNVPTGNLFKGIHDISVGIRERICFRQLMSELRLTNYEIPSWRYWPFLLSPVILLTRLYQRRRLQRGRAEIRSDIGLPPAVLNEILYTLTRFEHYLPFGWFGSSLFVVAEKKRRE